MQASRYMISIPGFPRPGSNLLFHTRTQAQVVVDDSLEAALRGLPAAPATSEIAKSIDTLAAMGFVVGSPEEDSKLLEQWCARIRADDATLRPTILTTYACNLACRYCVEQGVLQDPLFMSEQTALEAAAYIAEKCGAFGSRSIALNFYGGEPLLNLPAIRASARSLHSYAREKGIAFGFALSTNGVLLTPAVIGELLPFGLTGAKITLDGPRDTHDRNRPFKGGRGSFDALIAVIQAAAPLLPIQIEVNHDEQNVGRIPELLDLLASLGLRDKIQSLVFSPISPTPKDREGLVPAAELPCAITSLESAVQVMGLKRMAMERGFPVSLGVVARLCEMVAKRSSFVIDPHGDLYRCGGFAGRKGFGFGSIHGQELDPFLGKELWRRCEGCAYAPLCTDGCLFGAFVRFGDPLRLNCGRQAMAYQVPESLKLAYRAKARRTAP
jgi:uncharacterized protein